MLACILLFSLQAQELEFDPWFKKEMPGLLALYQDLHQNPELSWQEERTAGVLAKRLAALGFSVESGIGGHGLLGRLQNGPGPVLLLRTDMDGLPIVEQTGLPYSSKVLVNTAAGKVGVMHACGHDVHMTAWIGAAAWFANHLKAWSGELLLLAQPAEEVGGGAKAMLADGLWQRASKPDAALALHTTALAPAGAFGICAGFALANVDSVDILVRGRGGHGSTPEVTKDPVVLAAKIVVALQTIVSREVDPQSPAVVTVGSIQGGTKHNIIPNEVRLQLTVRTYAPDIRRQVLAAIERIALGQAHAAGFGPDLLPRVRVREEESIPSLWNDPDLLEDWAEALRQEFGAAAVVQARPVMGGEDFALYGPSAGCPIAMLWLGVAQPEAWRAAQQGGPPVANIHTAEYAPAAALSLRAGVVALVLGGLQTLAVP